VWGSLLAAELGLAAGVALGLVAASYAAAALMLGFAAALALALRAGRSGAPCACFGSRSRVRRLAVARNLVLAAAFVALPWLPPLSLDVQGWLVAGLVFALAAIAALAVAVLALAREVGLLRLQLPPQAALDVPHEGPPLGTRTALAGRFEPGPDARFALAVFSSEGCRLCRSLEPAVDAIGRDPLVSVEVFGEERDHDVWRELAIPGAPFAVVLDLDGIVLAKGTFNSYAQLEGVLAAAERHAAAAIRA
jgi:hypothetical protein